MPVAKTRRHPQPATRRPPQAIVSRRRRPRTVRAIALAAAVGLTAGLLSACSSSGGVPTLVWYINPDNGSQKTLAGECSTATYKIKTQLLPNDASSQRQQLVQRLSAKDSSIDLMSLDPVFVAEFAQAGFLGAIPTSDDAGFTQNIVAPSVQASTWQGKLVAAPFWANTQLLWYRKSVAAKAGLDMTKPVTWDQVIQAAKKTGTTVGVQADQYEGYTVWINALVASAGGKILENPGATADDTKLGLDSQAGRDAAKVIQEVASQGVGGPALSTSEETQALDLFESGSQAGFLVNWPYTWAALGTSGINYISDIGWVQYPQGVAGTVSHPPFGGIEVAKSKYSKHQDLDEDAMKCITSEQHQTEYMVNSGNPAANTQSFDDPQVKKLFPMADLIRSSLEQAAPRPQSQFYGDLSGALQKSFSPPNHVNQNTPAEAQKFILQVIKGEKLL